MTTKFEYNDIGDDSNRGIYGINWSAQTFTVSTGYAISSVRLKLKRLLLPGTITISIRATDGSGHPTGADLCVGTTNGDTLTDADPGEWREIVFTTAKYLAPGVYGIVVRALSGDSSNRAVWRFDSSGSYAGGNEESSSDSGGSWSALAGNDFMFENWGFNTPAIWDFFSWA